MKIKFCFCNSLFIDSILHYCIFALWGGKKKKKYYENIFLPLNVSMCCKFQANRQTVQTVHKAKQAFAFHSQLRE